MQRHLPFVLGALFVLSACGGGSNTTPPPALPPVANLGGTSGNPQQAAGAPKFTVVDLGANVFPHAINLSGEVVGATGTNPQRAFSYSNGAMHTYGTLPGDTNSEANDVNDSGVIVGDSSDPGIQAVVFTSSAIVPLGSVPPYTRSSATAINNQGEIVGDGPDLSGGCGDIGSGIKFDGHGGATPVVNPGDTFAVNDAGVIVGGDCVDGENLLPWESTGSVSFPRNACYQGNQHFTLKKRD